MPEHRIDDLDDIELDLFEPRPSSTSDTESLIGSISGSTVQTIDRTEELVQAQVERDRIMRSNRLGFPPHISYDELSSKYGGCFVDSHHIPDEYLNNYDHKLCFHNLPIHVVLREADSRVQETAYAVHARKVLFKFKELAHLYPSSEIPRVFSAAVADIEAQAFKQQAYEETPWLIKLIGCMMFV